MTNQDAYDLGHTRGANAGEWYFDGNTEEGAYARVLEGIEEGDPEVLDTFPTFCFGEWAGESCAEVFPDWEEMDEYEQDDATEAYLQGFDDGAGAMIEQTARQYLGR